MKAEDYVHRIGRTGRAGRDGLAVTLAERMDAGMIRRIQQFTTQSMPVATIAGLEPKAQAPKVRRASAPDQRWPPAPRRGDARGPARRGAAIRRARRRSRDPFDRARRARSSAGLRRGRATPFDRAAAGAHDRAGPRAPERAKRREHAALRGARHAAPRAALAASRLSG